MPPFQEFMTSGSPQRGGGWRRERVLEDVPARTTPRQEYRILLKMCKSNMRGLKIGIRLKFTFLDFFQRIKSLFSFGRVRVNMQRSRLMFVRFVFRVTKSLVLPRVPMVLRRNLTRSQLTLLLAIMKAVQDQRNFMFMEERRNKARVAVVSGGRLSSVDVGLVPDVVSQIDGDLMYWKKKTSDAKVKSSSLWADVELERMKMQITDKRQLARDIWGA